MSESQAPYNLSTSPPIDRRQLRPISDRELVLLNFVRNQLNRCCQQGTAIEVKVRISEWGVNWEIVK